MDSSCRTRVRAVIFDFGGVLFYSPMHVIAQYEKQFGITPNMVNKIIGMGGSKGAFSRLERGELTLEEFCRAFEAECREFGVSLSAADLMTRMTMYLVPRPRMFAAILALRDLGFKTAAITNNWKTEREMQAVRDGNAAQTGFSAFLKSIFDVYIESSLVKMRKPDPKIFEECIRQLGVPYSECIFLDDIGRNLRTARQLGMHTILVKTVDGAIRDLSAVLGLSENELLRRVRPKEVSICHKTAAILRAVALSGAAPIDLAAHYYTDNATYSDPKSRKGITGKMAIANHLRDTRWWKTLIIDSAHTVSELDTSVVRWHAIYDKEGRQEELVYGMDFIELDSEGLIRNHVVFHDAHDAKQSKL